MQQGAAIILIFLWVLAIIIMLFVLRGSDDSALEVSTSSNSYSSHSKPLPQIALLCLSQ